MDNLDFSEEEIQEQLATLGYKNIPKHRLREFKQDLDELVRRGEWKSVAPSAQINTTTSRLSPPAYTKEKVSQHYIESSGDGFFLHARKADHDRHVTTCQSRDHGRQHGGFDSYAQHSVSLNVRLPPGAPSRLQVEVEPDPKDTLHPPLSDSYTSAPDSHRQHFIKRKVLRKYNGQSLICDESVYSEDSARCLHRSHTSAGLQVANMYKMDSTQRDDDDNSLNSSFWSDGERQEDEEEEEKVEIKRVIGEKDLKPVVKESYQGASVEEEEVEIGEEESKPVGDADDSYPEASKEQEEEIGKMMVNEDSKPFGDAEDSHQEASEEEEEVETSEEDSNLVDDAEDSHQEASEEEEEVETGEEDSSPVEDSEDSYQDASEEEEEVESSEEDSKPAGDADDSYPEASEEEEIGKMRGNEDSKPVGDAEDSHQEEEVVETGEEDSKPVEDSEDSYQDASDEDEEVISEEDSSPVDNAEDSYQDASEEEEEKVKIEGVNGEEESNSVGDAKNFYSEEEKVEINNEDSKPVDDSEDIYKEASEEQEEKVEMEFREENSKPLDGTEDSYQEASEEKEEEIDGAIFQEDSKPLDHSEDSHQEASEEEEEIERMFTEEESKPVGDTEDSNQEASEEEKPEQINISGKSLEGRSKDDDEESRSSSSDSPAPSLMTSGYGTYRPEEQEGGDYRDDHTITEFDQDSRGDLSEMRDDEEDDRSLCSFGGFDIETTETGYIKTRPPSVLTDAEREADVLRCGDADLHKEVDITDMKPEAKHQADEEKFEDEGGKQKEGLEEEVQDLKEEKGVEDKVESEDPDDSSSNKDIKFIDSKVDFSGMTFEQMCEEWEGNLRRQKDAASCLEERLDDLHLSSSAPHDLETGNEDVTSDSDTQSSETEGVSFSAFESYLRGMTQTGGDLRPKPKSFIRPVMSQQTIKKMDPVAKYFQYKQFWEMFKLPGETDRRALRWEIKEQLAYQPPPPKPRRVYVPNSYIVPTEKKRSALRWKIRNDLANGLLPYKYSY